MRINCHAHTFNLQSVFSEETLEILLHRVVRWDFPEWLLKIVADQLGKLITLGGEYNDPDRLAREIMKAVVASDEYRGLLESLSASERVKLEGIDVDGLEELASLALGGLFKTVGKALLKNDGDARTRNIVDILDFVLVGTQPSVRQVTETVMKQLGSGRDRDGLITLTMDITKGGDADEAQFLKLLADTSQTVLSYPGRIFPFVAVNPRRDRHFAIMERALNSQGFVGVKIYPCLGFLPTSSAMDQVYAYCQQRSVPVLMHCNEGGFYRSPGDIPNCNPAHWRDILDRFPDLKICFGHFGGGDHLTERPVTAGSWTETIIQLMREYPNAYADISYHAGPMDGGDAEAHYFANLKELINDPETRDHVLFGTDFFLVRHRLREKSFWQFFEGRLTKAEFKRIAEQNPRRYLGLPVGNKPAGWAIENYARFLWDHQQKLALESPVPWVEPLIEKLYGSGSKLPKPGLSLNWNRANRVHVHTYKALKVQLRGSPKFATSGKTRLHRLDYWNKGLESPAIWANRLSNESHKLDAWFLNNDFAHLKGMTSMKAVNRLRAAFDDETLAMWELAAVCESIYRSTRDVEGG